MIYAFDIEILKNFFSVTFVEIDNESTFQFYKFEGHDCYSELSLFMAKNPTLVGFNNINFDNIILNGFMERRSCQELFEIAQQIMNSTVHNLKYTNYKTIDLMRILDLDKLGVSLKRAGMIINFHRIQEIPVSYDEPVTSNQIEMILSYNLNDVLITRQLYKAILPQIKLREEISNLFGINVINASDSRMGNLILESVYSKYTGLHKSRFKYRRTIRTEVMGHECIAPNIKFHSKPLLDTLYSICETNVLNGFDWRLYFNGKTYDLGIGGLHSKDEPAIFESSSDYQIIDTDASSFYPHMMILNKIKPEHLGSEFFEIFKQLLDERLEAKRNKYEAKSYALKITINAIFGKLGNEHYWLYDPKAMLQVTVSGQLYLLMLIEILNNHGIETISANTDGIISKVHNYEKYEKACKLWMEMTGFLLESNHYQKYIRRDVNNYIAVDAEGKTKRKGIFDYIRSDNISLMLPRGYQFQIIPKVLEQYFLYNKPIEESILSSTSIYDFMMSQRIGHKFNLLLKNKLQPPIKIQNTSRFYVSNSKSGDLVKRSGDKETSILAGVPVAILNDVPDMPIEEFDIDYSYYIGKANEIVELIEPSVIELSLF